MKLGSAPEHECKQKAATLREWRLLQRLYLKGLVDNFY
jgi:hypothetical protein